MILFDGTFSCGPGNSLCTISTVVRLDGAFTGTTVSGTLNVGDNSNPFTGCCTHVDRAFTAALGDGSCTAAVDLSCGDVLLGASDAPGSRQNADHYACNSWTYEPPEFAYAFQPAADDQVSVFLTDLEDDLDLLLLQDEGTGCHADSCIDDSTRIGTSDELLSWNAAAGETYHVVVDGFDGAISNYTLYFLCASSCAGIGDADGDGICDDADLCPGADDKIDRDMDSLPDACDSCSGDNTAGDNDGDGICDGADLCFGNDAIGDSDGDGFCDDTDVCPGFDDNVDTDGDGAPDGCIFGDSFESGDMAKWGATKRR